jgi:hypothetical protein
VKIEPIHCPACFAAATIPPGADRVTCEYCGTTSFIEQSQGQVTLKFAHELEGLRQTLQDSSAQTAQSVRATAEDTQKELQRLRLSQELSTVDARLGNTQAELRALQRGANKKNKMVKTQIASLERQSVELSARSRQLQTELNLLAPASASAAAVTKGRAGKSGGRGCLMSGLLWFVLFTVLGGLLGQIAGEVGLLLALVASIAIVVYLQRRRAAKPAQELAHSTQKE